MTTAVTVWEDFDVPAHARGGQVTLNLYDHLAAYAPKRPGAYLRISSDRFGLETGVDRQLEDAEDSRSRLRWGPFAKIYRENDTSAFKKRKVIKHDGAIDWMVLRPEFRQLTMPQWRPPPLPDGWPGTWARATRPTPTTGSPRAARRPPGTLRFAPWP